MPVRSIADFVEKLDAAGLLRRIAAEVSPQQEIAEITARVAAGGGPALLFERVAGRRLPLVTNLLGTERRICLALCAESLQQATDRLAGPPSGTRSGWIDWLKASLQTGGGDPLAPRAVRTSACQQVIRLGRDVDLTTLPAVSCSQHESGPALFGACVVSGGCEPGERSLGIFDLPLVERNCLAIRWSPSDPIARQFEACRLAGQKMPVAVLLGVAPALYIAGAAAQREPQADPYALAGLLGAEAVDVVTCRTHALQVPAEADVVIEGTIDPSQPPLNDMAGGNSGGYLHLPAEAHAIQVAALTERTNPVVSGVIPSLPPDEQSLLSRAVMRLWLPSVQRLIPGLVDCDTSAGGRAGQFAFLAIRKTYPREARRVAAAWWGQPATMTTKFVVLVDGDVNVHDERAVWYEVGANSDLERDLFFLDGPADVRDHALAQPELGRHMAIDATTKLPAEQPRGWPPKGKATDEIRRLVTQRWAEYGLG